MAEFHLNKRERQRKRQGRSAQAGPPTPMSGNRRRGKRGSSGPKPDETVMAEETGSEGIATVRISAVRDPNKQAQKLAEKQRRQALAAERERQALEDAAPRRRARPPQPNLLPPEQPAPAPAVQAGIQEPPAPPVQPARVSRPPPAPPGTTAPVPVKEPDAGRRPVGPPEVPQEVPPEAKIPVIPVRLTALSMDGVRREGVLNATALTHGHVYQGAGQDAHGQRLFQLRAEAAVRAQEKVEVQFHNDGPRAKIAVFLFSGDRMVAEEVELGTGVAYTMAFQGRFDGHLEVGYAPVQR